MEDNNDNMIPEADRLRVVLPRYLAGYVDTISQAVQRIADHMTSGLAQFPNIISIVPLQVVGHFAGLQFANGPGLGLGFSNTFSSGAQVFGQVANDLTSGLQLQAANNSVLQLQGAGNDDHVIQMPPDQESASMEHPTQQLARDIWRISIPTLVIAIGTALYCTSRRAVFFSATTLSHITVPSVLFSSQESEKHLLHIGCRAPTTPLATMSPSARLFGGLPLCHSSSYLASPAAVSSWASNRTGTVKFIE